MTLSTNDQYRIQLQSELRRRSVVNPRYSLRSFSRDLGVSPAFLSKVLRGERNISVNMALQLAKNLKYSNSETRDFCEQARFSAERADVREALYKRPEEEADVPFKLGIDRFQVISDWYHYALRELVQTTGFRSDPKWIAKRLGISAQEATLALDRLQRLGLIKKSGLGYLKTENLITTPSDQPSQALRNHHTQMIEKAQQALGTQAVDQRDITGITMPISADKINLAKTEIKTFRRRMAKLLDSSRPTEVYQLNVQFFSLSKPEDKKP